MSEAKLLLDYFDPFRFAQLRQSMNGTIAVQSLPRILAECYDTQTTQRLEIRVVGDVDEQGIHYLQGHIMGELPLVCQRCMQQCTYSLNQDFLLSPVENEMAIEQVPSVYEAIILNNERLVSLVELLEEEILLQLPMVVRHDFQDCAVDKSKFGKND